MLFIALRCVCSGSDALTSMDIVKTCCQNFSEALQLATDQRYAHEYGDTAVAQELQTQGENEFGMAVEKLIDCQKVLAGRAAPRARSRTDAGGVSGRASEPKAAIAVEEKERRSRDAPGATDLGDALFLAKKRRSLSSALRRTPVIDYEDLQRYVWRVPRIWTVPQTPLDRLGKRLFPLLQEKKTFKIDS